MKILLSTLFLAILLTTIGCTSKQEQPTTDQADQSFSAFEDRFLDAYWKQHPTYAIFVGYGKYYDLMTIPDSAGIVAHIAFSQAWLDSLNQIDLNSLSDNNKISLKIIKNQLESDIWYIAVFKQQEWDASVYNLAAECDYILNQPYAPLDERLQTLSQHISNSDAYYKAAASTLRHPTKEHLELSIMQNEGGLSVFGQSLTDSINVSHLDETAKSALKQNIAKTVTAIKGYVNTLKAINDDKNSTYRDFRIGKEMFDQKFKYDLATDFTPEEIYAKASADKQKYHSRMTALAKTLWVKYYPNQDPPKDSMQLIQLVLDKIQLQHATPAAFFDSLTSHVYRLKKFIIAKDLFDFDTAEPPIKVRIMPPYARGFSVASAEFTPPYQKSGTTYYNIDDLTLYPPDKAEGVLKEYNNYSSQLLSIHEAVPGHCLQGIYNNKKSPDVVRAVFQNGAMTEGWAVYAEDMLLEEGWGNHSPELELVHDKLILRSLANVMIDYELQVLNKSKEDLVNLMVKECFQTTAQAEEKYHRATLSQVQLCSYYAGSTAVQALREDYKKKMGEKYSLKEFHESFLSYGSSPVKYIREVMLK
jgi:uncharacterized protein (DUF885 family)